MANKIIGFKESKGWFNLYTTTAVPSVHGLMCENFNVKADRIVGGNVEIGAEIDVLYGRGFDNRAYIKQINILGKGVK